MSSSRPMSAPARDAGVGLMDVKEAAAFLDINAKTLYRRAVAGDVPAVRLWPGRRAPLRFDPAELRAWLESRRIQSARPRAIGRSR